MPAPSAHLVIPAGEDFMPEDLVPDSQGGGSLVRRFLYRMSWRREVGPVSAEAHILVRDLNIDPEPPRRVAEPLD